MSVYSLCYVSRALVPVAQAEAAVADIVAVARERNARLDVTGALLFSGARFAQVLEGPEAGVAELMVSIRRDGRHTDVMVVSEGPVDERAFAAWTLAYSGPSTYVDRSIAGAFDGAPEGTHRLLRLFREFAAESRPA